MPPDTITLRLPLGNDEAARLVQPGQRSQGKARGGRIINRAAGYTAAFSQENEETMCIPLKDPEYPPHTEYPGKKP